MNDPADKAIAIMARNKVGIISAATLTKFVDGHMVIDELWKV